MNEESSKIGPGTETSAPDLKNLEAGLLETAKALRALSIYPPKHPQRSSLIGQAFGGVQSALTLLGDLSFQVRASGFYFQEKRIGENQPMVRELAQEMHLRQVKSFSMRRELTLGDFTSFLELIGEAPERFRQGRYVEQWIRDRQIQTMWVNEMDFRRLSTAVPSEEEAKEKPEEISRQTQLLELLEPLDTESDPERFAQLLRQAEVLARPLLEAGEYEPAWRLLAVVSFQATEEARPGPAGERIRALALRSVRALAAGPFLIHLLGRYLEPKEPDRSSLHGVFLQVGAPIADQVLDLISRTEAIGPFRPLLELVPEIGPPARPVLEGRLRDDNPLAQRRALFLLGELKARESIEPIRALLGHPESKVRKEAVRALTRIRGIEASRALIGFLRQGSDPELELLIVQSLGDNKDLAAAPALVSLLLQRPLREDTVGLLEATAEALGRIGSREALPPLIKALNSWKLVNRELGLRVRLQAAEALGRLGGESAMQALARYARDRDDPLSRTCRAVLATLLAGGGPGARSEEPKR